MKIFTIIMDEWSSYNTFWVKLDVSNIVRPFQIDKLIIGLPSQKLRVGR